MHRSHGALARWLRPSSGRRERAGRPVKRRQRKRAKLSDRKDPHAMVDVLARATRAAVLWTNQPGVMRLFARVPVSWARRALVALGDPLVPYKIGEIELELPLSHDLPMHQRMHPLYDTALARVAKLVWQAHPNTSVVDVGANVGDTAACIRSSSQAQILAVEGNPSYLELLRRNAMSIRDVTVEYTLVGTGAPFGGTWRTETGTGRMVPSANGSVNRTEMLVDVVARHPELAAPKLVKIDTDGFDCPIVEASMDAWRRWRPVLFFEYVPDYYAPDWSPLPMFAALLDAGYERALFYDQYGEFLASVPLSDASILVDLHTYHSGRYADLCLFHRDDREIAMRFQESERAVARLARTRIGSVMRRL